MTRVSLTERDIELLEEVRARRAVPVEHLAARFFGANPLSGEPNKDPEKACLRRLDALAAAGLVMKFRAEDGRRPRVLVGPGPNARAALGGRAHGRVPARNLGHHARTQDALLAIEQHAAKRGGQVVSVRVEQQLRADAQRGTFLKKGDSFAPFPDAACVVELPGSPGGGRAAPRSRRVRVAIEYVTSKYTDADIQAKHEGFVGYDEVLWFADRPRTAERVRRITGARCSIMR